MKALKALVIALAILIAAGVGVLVWGMSRAMRTLAPSPTTASTALNPPMEIVPPQGMHFEQMAPAGDRLALRFSGPQGQRILLVDPQTGKVTGTLSVPGTQP